MADAPTPQELPKPSPRRFFWPGGLSARLLVLTVLCARVAQQMPRSVRKTYWYQRPLP